MLDSAIRETEKIAALGQLFETHPAQGEVELKIREPGMGARLSAVEKEKEKDAIFDFCWSQERRPGLESSQKPVTVPSRSFRNLLLGIDK